MFYEKLGKLNKLRQLSELKKSRETSLWKLEETDSRSAHKKAITNEIRVYGKNKIGN